MAIESIAHACFRIQCAGGSRILIDPYASRVWLGYDFPDELATDAILITHPHFDHDGGEFIGRTVPWMADVPVLRDPGRDRIGDFVITGIRGKHADPWGAEFGQTNTMWLVEAGGLRVAHLGDNGPLTEQNLQDLSHVDILLIPIDAEQHILKNHEIRAIRHALRPRVLIPMHYRHPDLEISGDRPQGLGPIDPWLADQESVTRLGRHYAVFTPASLGSADRIVVLEHSTKVGR